MRMATLWIGDRLGFISRLALSTWLEHTEGVDLYVEDLEKPPEGIPEGVVLHEASQVLPLDLIDRLKPLHYAGRSPYQERASYSDIFRISLMKRNLGFWMDTDVILFRDFNPSKERAWFAFDGKNTIGVSALYFPSDDPLVDEYLQVLDVPDLMPPWAGFKRAVLKQLMFKILGRSFSPTDLGITIYGNDAITRLIRLQDRLDEAEPQVSLYCLTGKRTEAFYEPSAAKWLLESPEITGLHVHRKARSSVPPITGSAFDILVDKYNLGRSI